MLSIALIVLIVNMDCCFWLLMDFEDFKSRITTVFIWPISVTEYLQPAVRFEQLRSSPTMVLQYQYD